MAASAADGELAIARSMGALLLRTGEVSVGGERHTDLRIVVKDNADAIKLLDAFATNDARTSPRVQAIARGLVGASPLATATAIQRFVASGVRFQKDKTQTFRRSDVTLSLGYGNCVNTARLVAALARAAGIPAQLVPVVDDEGAIVHVAAQLDPGGGWQWAEACAVGAKLGESPYDVARDYFGGRMTFT